MGFTDGFIKTAAGLPGAESLGKLVGGAVKATKGVQTAAIEGAKATRQSFTGGMRETLGKAPIGANVAKKSVMNNPAVEAQAQERISKINETRATPLSQEQGQKVSLHTAQQAVPQEAKAKAQEIQARAKNIQDIRQKNKQSFAGKHPLLTGLGAYGAMQMAFGGGGDKQPAAPPVAYGGQYY